MKRILQRIWKWDWSMGISLLSLAGIAFSVCFFMRPILPVHAADVAIPEADIRRWITNWPGEYITNLAAIEWTGYELRYKPQIGNTKACELGLRSDGTVVWRGAAK